MPSNAESRIASQLPRLLARFDRGAEIHDAPELAEILSAMEWFVGEILGEVYPEWVTESLDGITPHFLRKVGAREIELFGLGIILSDQTLVPLHVRLQVDPEGNDVSWLECRLGEAGPDGMVRTPYKLLRQMQKQLSRGKRTPRTIDWVYQVTFGKRRD